MFISLKQIRLSGFSIQHGCRTMANTNGTMTMRLQFFRDSRTGITPPDDHITFQPTLENLKVELGY